MTLPPPVRAAVLEVVRLLRDPMRECHVDSVGVMVLDSMPHTNPVQRSATLDILRLSLGLSPIPGSLARWAQGKSREEVAQALERVAKEYP